MKQRGFILIYLLFLLVMISQALLYTVFEYEQLKKSQYFDQQFEQLLEKSFVKTSKSSEKCYNEA
ncbi:MAG: hypothetical protein ACRDAO_05405 [Culicoidibacterales bacterium]